MKHILRTYDVHTHSIILFFRAMLSRPTIAKQLHTSLLDSIIFTAKYATTTRPRSRPIPPTSIPSIWKPIISSLPFSSLTPVMSKNQLPPRMKIDEADTTVSYLKGTGPGGQKINKTNSAVQLIHKPTGTVIKCQQTRSRSQNEKIARQLLADRVEAVLKGDQSRVAIKTERARNKKASKMKKSRRKYRELESRNNEHREPREEKDGNDQDSEVEGEGNDHELELQGLPREEQRDRKQKPQ